MSDEDLLVIEKAKELAKHTLKVTSNANRYPKKFRFSLVDKMQNKSLEIYEMLFEAGRIKANARIPKGLYYRQGLQLEEISDCKASRKNRKQCGPNYGRKACRSKLSVSESR